MKPGTGIDSPAAESMTLTSHGTYLKKQREAMSIITASAQTALLAFPDSPEIIRAAK